MEHPDFDVVSSIQSDGSRPKVILADVRGYFTRIRKLGFLFLVALFFILPFVKFAGERWVLLQIDRREFTLFGIGFNAQDVYLLFFVVTGSAFTLFFLTAAIGRVWCGFACPQTVFLEGVYRPIERWIEGSRAAQIRLAKGPWNLEKLWKFLAKHFIFIFISLSLSVFFISYFVPLSFFSEVVQQGMQAHPTMVTWVVVMSFLLYGNFAWFREQLCLIICPYGRLQSAMTDDDTITIGYDEKRGEPRGKANVETNGDCIDCKRCLVVCPTGIDIRKGLQMECIGCANCIDACDEIMENIGKPAGLIRYDSLNGLEGRPKKLIRPRMILYTALLLLGALVFGSSLFLRESFEANLLRLPGKPYELLDRQVQNRFEIHVINKSSKRQVYTLVASSEIEEAKLVMPIKEFQLEPKKDRNIPLFVRVPRDEFKGEFTVRVILEEKVSGRSKLDEITFLGPR